MRLLEEQLIPPANNPSSDYWPIRNKDNNFDWDLLTGTVLSFAIQKKISNYTRDQFLLDCKIRFESKLDDVKFWDVIERMYFSSDAFFNISPTFLLLKAQSKNNKNAANVRLESLFQQLMGSDFSLSLQIEEKLNFLETEISATLLSNLTKCEPQINSTSPYLPFLVDVFRQDLTFLTKNPRYFLQEITNVLKLYAFSYCSQLALNILSWREGVPKSKPLYFILDSEKASSERVKIKNHGFKALVEANEHVFPILSMLETLQPKQNRKPLWQLYSELSACVDSRSALTQLNQYIHDFRHQRDLTPMLQQATTLEQSIEQLLKTAIDQFQDKKTTRSTINAKYIKAVKEQFFANFIQSRGRAGGVLVLNHRQLLLLTNLAIGKNETLRLHELIECFKQRGFYFDNQSEQMLINFYQLVGNIEKMSDSGDAVYVRKTI